MIDFKLGWKRVRFGEIATHIAERAEPMPEDTTRYVGLEHLESGNLTVRRWGSQTELVGTKLRMRQGDILFARRNAYLRRVAIAPHDGLFSAHGMVLRPKPPHIVPEFLPFFMQSDAFMDRAEEISVGSLSPTINWTSLRDEEFILPPLEEQRRSLKILVAIETIQRELVAAREAVINLRDRLRINVFADHNELQRIGDVLEFITSGSRGWSKYYSDEGAIFLRIGNLNSPTIELNTRDLQYVKPPADAEAQRTRVHRNDVLLGITGDAGIGLVGIVRDANHPTFVSQHVAVIRVKSDKCCPIFLAHMLASPGGQRQVAKYNQAGAKSGMTLIAVRDLRFPSLPIRKQRQLGEQLSGLETGFVSINNRLKDAIDIRRRETNRLLSGGV